MVKFMVVKEPTAIFEENWLMVRPKPDTAILMPSLVREYRFHPTRKWSFDYVNLQSKVAIEIHGGTHMARGGHTTGVGFEKDREKINAANLQGWVVFELTAKTIKNLDLLVDIGGLMRGRCVFSETFFERGMITDAKT